MFQQTYSFSTATKLRIHAFLKCLVSISHNSGSKPGTACLFAINFITSRERDWCIDYYYLFDRNMDKPGLELTIPGLLRGACY